MLVIILYSFYYFSLWLMRCDTLTTYHILSLHSLAIFALYFFHTQFIYLLFFFCWDIIFVGFRYNVEWVYRFSTVVFKQAGLVEQVCLTSAPLSLSPNMKKQKRFFLIIFFNDKNVLWKEKILIILF